MDDLVSTFKDNPSYGDLREKLQQLQKMKPLLTPLPDVVINRETRKAGYEKTSKDISKWQSFVQKNRTAETLNFPLNPTTPMRVTNAELAAKFEPTTDMEKEVAQVLRESGIEEQKIKEFEDLEMNKLNEAQIAERRTQLSKLRNLLFYQELKWKRQKKIKSKTYRRILKKIN